MCGIAGFYAADTPIRDAATQLKIMADMLAHRGPDGAGIFVKGRVGLAHRRLAVIDLSERAAQPMTTPDDGLTCTFNGEIYNFQSLRKELERKGYCFTSKSDTEVLLHGYRAWGEDLPSRLEGMFAFAIWDHKEESLFLARDRFGKKPLSFAWVGSHFVFASEHKAILRWPGFERRANLEAIHHYLSFKFIVGETSAFKGIQRLSPAHSLLVTRKHDVINRPQPRRYWSLPSEQPDAIGTDDNDLEQQFLGQFDAAIAKRLVADVPVGAFLSGGVDSSAIVARASAMSGEKLKTFSAGFAFDGFDETEYARRIAQQFGTEHRSFTMGEDLADLLPQIVWNYSDPFADSSALVTTALAKEVRRHVTVALTGDGGDEIFLGYQRYAKFSDDLSRVGLGRRDMPLDVHLARLFGPEQAKDVYARRLSAMRDIYKEWGYGATLLEYLFSPSSDLMPNILNVASPSTALACAGRADVDVYLPNDLMVKTDIATMAFGLEARSPFLDHHLAEWAVALPQQKRLFHRDGMPELKGLVKKAMEPQIDKDILYRTKMGFRVPVARWLRGQLKDLAYDLLTSQTFRERDLIRPQFIEWMLNSHVEGAEDHSTQIWCLMVLEVWFRTFIDRVPDGPIALPNSGRAAILDEIQSI